MGATQQAAGPRKEVAPTEVTGSFEGRERSGSLAHEGDTEAKTSRASESLDALVRSSIYHIPDSACSDLFVLSHLLGT